ncbi:hypothetical protein [Streptomyces anulatus]|uniref:hypothetical protein n=1 Tax=Streptomyces anulatus TaxID=1892 RepID=UPI002F91B965|nr:hypothetical protein OG882_39120 [Streptomyces anulatus]
MTDRRPLGTGPTGADNPKLSSDTMPRAGLAAESLPAVQADTAAGLPSVRPDGRRTLGTGPAPGP